MAKEIITIELDDATLQTKLNNINKSLNENNKAIAKNNAEIKSLAATTKDLDKAFKNGSISADEYTDELERNATATSRLKEENRALSTENKKLATDQRNLTAIQQESVGSLTRLRGELNTLIKQYDKLSREQRNNADIGGALQGRIETLTVEISKAEQATGRFQRQVGNYAGAGEIFKEGLRQQGGALGNLANAAIDGRNAFIAAGTGVKGFSAALATTGIPLVIMAVQGLISVFSQFKPVADAVEDVVNALGAGFRALVTGGSITEAVKQSNALLNVIRELEDTQDAFNLSQQKGKNEIDRLIIASKDRTKTEQERIALLSQAEKLEKDLFNNSVQRNQTLLQQQQNNLKTKLKISDEELKLLAESTNAEALALRERLEKFKGLTDEELKEYQKTLSERAQLDGESAKFFEKVVNARNKIIEKEEAQQEKALEKAKARKEKELQLQQQYNENILSLQNEFLLTERERLNQSFNDKLAKLVGDGEKETELRLAIQAAQQKALNDFDKKQREAKFAELLQSVKTETEKEFDIRKQGLLLEQATKDQLDQFNFEKQLELLENEKQLRALNLEDITAIDNQILELKQANAERINAINKQSSDNAIALAEKERQAKVNAAQNVFGFVSSLAKRGSAIGKAAALGSIIAANAEAIAKGIASAVGVPFPANFPAIASVLGAVGSGIAQAKSVLGQADSIQGFATGGKVRSGIPIKRSNGDNILATLKTGEVVLNSSQQKRLGGASTFKAIGVPGFATGGVASAPITNSIESGNSLADQFSSAIENLKIFTAITDINTGQSNFTQVVERAQV